MGTEKRFKIVSFIAYMFVGSIAILGILFPIPEVLLDAIPKTVTIPLIIFFVLNSMVIASYCYYWGKYTGENKKIVDMVKQKYQKPEYAKVKR